MTPRRRFLLRGASFLLGLDALSSYAARGSDFSNYFGEDWHVPSNLALEIWPSRFNLTISEAMIATSEWLIPSTSRVVFRLEDGDFLLKESIIPLSPYGDRISIIGNIDHPSRCRLLWSNKKDLFYIATGKQIGYVDGITVEHVNFDTRGQGSAFLADSGFVRTGSNIIVRNFYYGFQARYGGVIRCSGAKSYNAGDANFFAFNGGHILAHGAVAEKAHDVANGLGGGFVAEYGGTIDAVRAVARYNALAGFVALSNGVIRAYDSRAEMNGKAGYYSNTGGVIVAHRALASRNCGEGVKQGNKSGGFEGERFKSEDNYSDSPSCIK